MRLPMLFISVVIFASLLSFPASSQAENSSGIISYIEVDSNVAYVFQHPSILSPIVQTLSHGDAYPILRKKGNFYEVMLLGRQTGWILASQGKVKTQQRLVVAWNALGTSSEYMLQSNSPHVDVVSPGWIFFTDDPALLSTIVDPDYIDWAHRHGKKIWPMLGNRFDPELTGKLLSDPDTRTKLVDKLRDLILHHQMDGINVDVENIDPQNADDFVQFVAELRRALHPYKKVVSVDVTRTNPDPFWSGSYNRRALGEVADYVVLMGYEQHWAGSTTPGPVGSLPWVEEGIQLLLDDVPAHKVLLGVPFYTREWVTNLETGEVTSFDRTLPEVKQLIEQKGLHRQWDDEAKQAYVTYTEAGSFHQIWLEDEQTVSGRLTLVELYHLGGVAA